MGFMGVFQQARHEQPEEVGNGFKVYDVVLKNGTETDLIIFDHGSLVNQIHAARIYSQQHGGDLPNNEFWDKTVDALNQNKGLFTLTHQCSELSALLRRNAIYDRDHPVIPICPPPIDCGSVAQCPPDGPPVCPSVPEPSSFLLMSLSFAILMVAFCKKRKKAISPV